MSRPLAEIEQDIRLARRERDLYVSPQGVTGIHAKMDDLLDEWEMTRGLDPQPEVPHQGTPGLPSLPCP